MASFSSSPESWEEGESGAGSELVQAAFAADEMEAAVIQGLLEGGGIPSLLQPTGFNGPHMLGWMVAGGAGIVHGRGSRRVMVHAARLGEAQALLSETFGVENAREEWPEIANARNLEEAGSGKPRDYGFVGASMWIFIWTFGTMAAAFGLFMLFRAA